MKRSLMTTCLAAPLGLWAGTALASPTDLQGVCANPNFGGGEYGYGSIPSAELPAPLNAYCAAIREGWKRLADRPSAAQAEFRKAGDVAKTFTGRDDRARAEDEARLGLALAQEAGGETDAALRTLLPRSASQPDVIGLGRAMMLARRGLYTEAADRLAAVRPALGDCSWTDRAEANLRAGRPTGVDKGQQQDMSVGQYLPSWWAGCQGAKAALGLMPEVRSYHIDFDLGQATWPQTTANQNLLKEMVEVIKRNETGNLKSWRVAGHADQTCPKNGQDCDSYNNDLSLRRAEAVKAYLVRTLPGQDRAQRIQTIGYGMQHPLFNTGGEDRRNRRVDLGVVVEEQSGASVECPWQVRVYDTSLPGDRASGDVRSLPTRLVRPDETMTVGRGSAFDVRLDKALAAQGGWSHFYAASEDAQQQVAELTELGGARTDVLAEFTGILPASRGAGKVFVFSPGSTQEIVTLVVAQGRLDKLDEIRQAQRRNLTNIGSVNSSGKTELLDDQKLVISPAKDRTRTLGTLYANLTKGAKPIPPSGVGPTTRRNDDTAHAPPPAPPPPATPVADGPKRHLCQYTLTLR